MIFFSHNSTISHQIPIKSSSHTATISLNDPLKFQPIWSNAGWVTSQKLQESGERSRFFIDIEQFLAYNSAVTQPISLRHAVHIATILPNNPLKFKPDQLRWGWVASRAVIRKSTKNWDFLPIFGHISTEQKYVFLDPARCFPENFSLNGSELGLVHLVTDRQQGGATNAGLLHIRCDKLICHKLVFQIPQPPVFAWGLIIIYGNYSTIRIWAQIPNQCKSIMS